MELKMRRLYTLQSGNGPRAFGMDWRQMWRWLREIEWVGSLARQLWAAVAAVGVLGSATMRTLWEDPVRLVFFILSSALLIVSVVSFWSGYRRLRNDRKTVADDVLEKAEEKTEENLRQAQEKSRKLEEELAKERQEVEQLHTKVDMSQTPKKKRKLPRNALELSDRELMEKILGKRVMKAVDAELAKESESVGKKGDASLMEPS